MNEITLYVPVWEGERGPLIKALVAAQSSSEAVLKASTNPAFRSRYADLAAVVEAVVPALNRAGVAVIQVPYNDGDLVTVTTILAHESGSTLTGSLSMRPTKPDPQGVGSAVTYARRYALLAMTGAAPEDDDGNAASSKTHKGSEYVTAAEAKHLETVADEVGASKPLFLKAMGVAAFDKFLASNYDAALAALEAKRAKNFRSNGSNGVAGNHSEMEHA